MADDTPADTGTEEDRVRSLDEQDKRIERLEAGQDTIVAKLDKILGIKPKDAPADSSGQAPSGGGGNIAEEIRAQLEDRDRKKAAADKEQGTADTISGLQAQVKELQEKNPEPLPRRVEKFMGWR